MTTPRPGRTLAILMLAVAAVLVVCCRVRGWLMMGGTRSGISTGGLCQWLYDHNHRNNWYKT